MSSGEDASEFNLSEFIEKKSALFVVMGVFAALALYISQITTEPISEAAVMIKLGYVSGFGVALLILWLIYSEMIEIIGSWSAFQRAHFHNAELGLFSLLNCLLVLSLTQLLTREEPVLFILILLATVGVVFALLFRSFYAIGQRMPKSPFWRIPITLLISLTLLGSSYYSRSQLLSEFSTATIYELSLSNPVPVITNVVILAFATIQSLAAIGVLASIMSIPIVILDKIRGTGAFDESTSN